MVRNTLPPPSKSPVPRIMAPPKVLGTLKDDKILQALKDYHVVHLESDSDYNEKLTWCLEHCQNKFRDFKENNTRAWYFKDEHDAVVFAMKWT